ncbi:MAG TPA: hybrid sensor histidine kinase/response regulator [Bacteroidetes bacterium]|nr:hybrid sensor histidine kinase/response regulator [Bacteroidota bacterium]
MKAPEANPEENRSTGEPSTPPGEKAKPGKAAGAAAQAAGETESAAEAAGETEAAGEETPLILIVDDEPLALDLSSLTLQRHGFRTETARGGEEGWSKVQEVHPDLVLLDITMPDISGFEVFDRIRKHGELQTLPVIFLSARDDVEHRVKGLELGAVDYITKPYNPSELAARVRTTLRMHRLEQELLERQREDIRRDAVNAFLTTVSHYINNAVAAIQGRASITDPEDPEAVERMISVVLRQSRVIASTIHAIEEMSKHLVLETTSYVSTEREMLDIEEALKNRLRELDERDGGMQGDGG